MLLCVCLFLVSAPRLAVRHIFPDSLVLVNDSIFISAFQSFPKSLINLQLHIRTGSEIVTPQRIIIIIDLIHKVKCVNKLFSQILCIYHLTISCCFLLLYIQKNQKEISGCIDFLLLALLVYGLFLNDIPIQSHSYIIYLVIGCNYLSNTCLMRS